MGSEKAMIKNNRNIGGVSKSSSKHYSGSKGVIGWYQKLETDVSFLNEKFRQHT